MNHERGFLSALFDTSFSELITTKVIKVLYVIAIIGAGLVALGYIIAAFTHSAGAGVLVLLVSPILFIVYVIIARIWLEVLIVIFRISEDVKRIADKDTGGA